MPDFMRLSLRSLILSLSALLATSNTYIESLSPSESKIRMLYHSLDPSSLTQHLAFYELYPHSTSGQQALNDIGRLLSHESIPLDSLNLSLASSALDAMIQLVNKQTHQDPLLIQEQDFAFFDALAETLPHSKLKGHQAQSEEEIWNLPSEQIDLARGLFLSQFGNDRKKIKTYEAIIDLMAIQVLARLPLNASPEIKILILNQLIFEEMHFRFPPHSLYAKDIDVYTFLPSVLDSHQGVCLGVSILYLCIAQRLSLPLEMVTPPGHIYIRYRDKDRLINIETTARGIHIDSDDYLSINTRSLQERTIKEVIGLAHFNQASVFWQKDEHKKALEAYKKALPYLPDDPFLQELMGYTSIVLGHEAEGKAQLEKIKDYLPEHVVVKETLAEDYLNGKINAEGIKAIFHPVDEERRSVLEKKEKLEKILQTYPHFRAGHFHLAITWLQLHRMGEALTVLNTYHTLENNDPTAHYYSAVLYAQRLDYKQAWKHLRQAERLVQKRNFYPKALKELRRELLSCCPE